MFSNVYITDSFQLGFPSATPFEITDIVDVEWEGYRGARRDSVPVEVTNNA